MTTAALGAARAAQYAAVALGIGTLVFLVARLSAVRETSSADPEWRACCASRWPSSPESSQ